MNLNNIFKKVSGIALAGAIAFAGFAGSAKASSPTPNNGQGESTDAPSITKTVDAGGKYFGGSDFKFNVARTTVSDNEYGKWVKPTADPGIIEEGERTVRINAGTTTEELTNSVDLGVKAPADSVQPGVYRYVITEKNPNISGMEENEQSFNVDVFIQSTTDNKREIVKYIVSSNGTKSNLEFTNKITTNDIKVTKNITGNQADLSDRFNFTITFTTENNANNTSVRVNGEALPAGGKTFELGDDESLTITGLATSDQVKIVESELDANNVENYETTIEATNTQRATIDNANKTITAYGDAGDITFTNDKNETIPTGLIENIAPFVLAIAAAGIVFFVYFKRNKEDEQYA
ncbi:Spy0128 family protein [Anaerococcus martiniensis]|uniref:DUF7601 domain-containing protein n=1 Tax=unclassified Anaerococcus TaxID=2614126 RepID=UPI001933528D|nr:FctA domain-containing protein [Anaerococcus sp. mt242]MBM0045636.1 hypothetical protein [Anaerococcus sp. mt242]